ncbi:XK-related protein 6-like [Porites lutea]|uniref:XK-related protein 6-like n=1 Tax=Porites lutea TaxID=51062 RepID=UPI003CC5603F
MAVNELKWYGIFAVLFGIILSIADPITDIFTLVEFYRTDHKTWFGVGLTFIILPSLFFLAVNSALAANWTRYDEESEQVEYQCTAWKSTHVFVLGCNPLFPAWLKLRTLYCYLKKLLKLRQGNNTDQTGENLDGLLWLSKLCVLAEAALESAPQFIIQLYALAVQQHSVSVIQMVSLPVSFLNLAWASTVGDEIVRSDEGGFHFSVKHTVLLFVTHLFILSSRLFAVALFTVSYKWWVTGVLILHCTVITICSSFGLCRAQSADSNGGRSESVVYFCLHWLRDDLSLQVILDFAGYTEHLRMLLLSNVLFVIENITMILLFYFSHFPHTWYSLPVTIYVCLFSVLGTGMRLTHFYFLTKESNGQSNNTDQVQQQSYSNPIEVAAT